MFPGARMVCADLITWYSAVHLAALSGWEGERGTLCGRIRFSWGQQGDGSGSRPESPTSPALGHGAHGAKDACKVRTAKMFAKCSRRKEGIAVH